jgi:DNA-binding Lrp family transcriptional regulator
MEELPEEFNTVVVGPHRTLENRRKVEELEKELLQKIRKEGRVNLSKLWNSTDCHLWEISYALRRLKEKGLIEEYEI